MNDKPKVGEVVLSRRSKQEEIVTRRSGEWYWVKWKGYGCYAPRGLSHKVHIDNFWNFYERKVSE